MRFLIGASVVVVDIVSAMEHALTSGWEWEVHVPDTDADGLQRFLEKNQQDGNKYQRDGNKWLSPTRCLGFLSGICREYPGPYISPLNNPANDPQPRAIALHREKLQTIKSTHPVWPTTGEVDNMAFCTDLAARVEGFPKFSKDGCEDGTAVSWHLVWYDVEKKQGQRVFLTSIPHNVKPELDTRTAWRGAMRGGIHARDSKEENIAQCIWQTNMKLQQAREWLAKPAEVIRTALEDRYWHDERLSVDFWLKAKVDSEK